MGEEEEVRFGEMEWGLVEEREREREFGGAKEEKKRGKCRTVIGEARGVAEERVEGMEMVVEEAVAMAVAMEEESG